MRILFTSVAGLGHVHPMVPLALALRDRGHDLRWATGERALGPLRAAGIDAVGAGMSNAMAEYRRRFPEAASLPPAEFPNHTFPYLFGSVSAPAMLEDLRGIAGWAPDLIVHDAAELAAPVLAAMLGVPNVVHSFGGVIPSHRVEAASEVVAPLWEAAGLAPRPYAGCYDHLYLDIYPPGMQTVDPVRIPRVQPLRPVSFDAPEGEPVPVAPPAGAGPLVYLTFGTVFANVVPLRAATGAVAKLPVRLLVTVGPGGDPDALGPQPANVRVERYVPQTLVFPSCDAVVSHCGSGTFLGALSCGLPQLCLPQGADQFVNAAACTASGVGLALVPEEAGTEQIAAAVQRLLADPAFRSRAEAGAAAIASMPAPDEVAARLEQDFG
jgi:UDP:flavonoid glycosyltransferase YjiC (YdhE family)